MVYAKTLTFPFVYEDVRWDTTPVALTPWSWVIGPRWLTSQSYAATTAIWGAGPAAAHAVSVAWHLLNGVLLWIVARRVVTPAAAVLAVGLFWLLPIQVEAVAGVAYRSELVAATALLLALWCVQCDWLIPAFACAAGAVLGKEMGVMALLLVPIWATRHRIPAWTGSARVYWLVASFPVALLVIDGARPYPVQTWAQLAASWTAIVALALHLGVGVSIDPAWPVAPIVTGSVLVLTAGAAETAWRRRWPAALWVSAFVVAAMLPRLVWDTWEGVHGRHLYTPMVAISVAIGSALVPKGQIA